MNIGEEANEVCKKAEIALRFLMQKAIESGEYRYLPTLARMAEQLNALSARIAQPNAEPAALISAAEKIPAGEKLTRHHGTNVKTRSNKKRPAGKPMAQPVGISYPKFRREGETLVKIGWSKNSKSQYEHRAPRRVVDALLKAVLAAGGAGKLFTVEGILPLPDPTDATEIPGYQVYLALAWFRTEGLLQQHGREGYSLFTTTNLEKTVEERWLALPDRKTAVEDK